jgi:hypothetical protein
MDSPLTFSFFEKNNHNLEGYVSQLANNHSIFNTSVFSGVYGTEGFNDISNDQPYQTYVKLTSKMVDYGTVKQNESNYDLIDGSGNLLYKKNMNFKETIPPARDAVLEDSIEVMNYNNYLYTISGISVAFLVVGVIIMNK